MIRREVSERVAMEISGYRTRSLFDRYNVTSGSDLAEAARKIEAGSENRDKIGTTEQNQIAIKSADVAKLLMVNWLSTRAKVAELADAPDLGSGGETHGGSSPPFRTSKLPASGSRSCPLRPRSAAQVIAGSRLGAR